MLDLHEHQMGDVNIPSKKVTPMTKRYRFFKDDYHGVVANLNLIEKNNTLVADGNFSACVYIGDKIYSINGEFEDHKIIAIESKDSMFPGDLKQLIGKPGHYVVHDFLEKKFNESINSTKQFGKHFDITKMLMLTSLLGFSMVITISCLLSLSRSQQVDIN